MGDLVGLSIDEVADRHVRLFWGAFPSLFFWSSNSLFFLSIFPVWDTEKLSSPLLWSFPSSQESSSQSWHAGNSLGHNYSKGVQIAQYFSSGDKGELEDWSASTLFSLVWSCLDAVVSKSLALMVAHQVLCMALGRGRKGPTFTFLGWESFSLLGLIRVTRLCLFAAVALGLDW